MRTDTLVHTGRLPYFRVASAIVLSMVLSERVAAQGVRAERHEAILLDVSGSMARQAATNNLYREYLIGIRGLLQSEPPSSRVWVLLISTESFGSIETMLRGWTPEARGVFTDDLEQARHQLSTSFESRSAGLAPTAAGTDIFGGLWRAKALLESAGSVSQRELFIVSDMINHSPALSMPSLLPRGAEAMMEYARSQGLVVPLPGYRVFVAGASTEDLTPQAWQAVKDFWSMYFREAGAELVTYSVEAPVRP